jgi:hypothetical protein
MIDASGTVEVCDKEVDVDDLDPGGISNASKVKLLGDSPKDVVTSSIQFLQANIRQSSTSDSCSCCVLRVA